MVEVLTTIMSTWEGSQFKSNNRISRCFWILDVHFKRPSVEVGRESDNSLDQTTLIKMFSRSLSFVELTN